MARPVKVYVSCALNELADERLAVKQTLLALPLSVDWDFNFTSLSTGSLSDEYLDRIWECDLFILIVGETVNAAVRREYELAVEAEKPLVSLVMDVPRDVETAMFVRGLKKKPRPRRFETLGDLKYQVEAGVSDELIQSYKRLRLDAAEMKELARQRVENIAIERRQARDWKGSAVMMGVLLIMVIVAVLIGRGNNTPPVIDRIASDPASVEVGQTSQLRVWAKDDGEGVLSYEWSVSDGTVEQGDPYDNPFAIFHAPEQPGVVVVRVVVADALGFDVEKTLEIQVVDEAR